MPRRILNWVIFVAELTVMAATLLDVVITVTSTFLRYTSGRDLSWAGDLSVILIAVIACLGAPAYFRRSHGMAYVALVERTHGLTRQTLRAIGMWMVIAMCGLVLYAYPAFLAGQSLQRFPVLGISQFYTAIWLGLGLMLMAAVAVEKLVLNSPRAILQALVIVLAIAGAVWEFHDAYYSGAINTDPFALVVPVAVVAFLTATPIPLILALVGALYYLIGGDVAMVAVPTAIQYGLTSFILLAIPFFMLVGALMEVTGMAKRLIDMVQEWVGHWKGGLLFAEVLATFIFSGISGSKAADMSVVGSVMKRAIRERGYPATEFAAVLAASAAMSETIPPSLAMLVLGSVTTLSVGALFIAGLFPAIVMGLCLMVAIMLKARGANWIKGPPFSLRRALGHLGPSVPALLVPVIVVGGIVGGVGSPTEVASFAVVYGFVVAWIVYRGVGVACWAAMRDATLIAGMVLLMVGTANLLGQVIITDGIGPALSAAFQATGDKTLFLILSVLAISLIGLVLEGFPAILIAAPIFIPIAQQLGVDPLQFGIVLIMATGHGVMMPPVGIGFYVACTVCDAPVNATIRPSLRYNLFLFIGLWIVVFLPQITLWLPTLLGLH